MEIVVQITFFGTIILVTSWFGRPVWFLVQGIQLIGLGVLYLVSPSFTFDTVLHMGKSSSLYYFTNPDWVPSQNLGHNKVNIKSVDRDANRYKRLQARDSRKKENNAVDGLLSLAMGCPSPSNDVGHGEEYSETSCQTTPEGTSISKMEAEIQRLIEEYRKLKTQFNSESKNVDQDFFPG
ncbi:hypothetical protein HOLleu_16345 [Holothuria leucospilota]|uniref:Uncharacterized protein n=1 Tax=Holothuria leucospilota TaxID=206669 RepID=A0A9Q1C5Z5_HOLLE|nr:hypothetical protein HOLleu_16345 [Holothuria leucospilota]